MFVADSLAVIGLATISLGTIQESDGAVERTFWLRNCGTESVAIVQGYTSCGCTTIQYDKEASIAPGDSACALLRFNPRGKGGEFFESGTLVYGNSRRHLSIALEGECVTSEETLMRQFPIVVSPTPGSPSGGHDSLRLSADRFDLGLMKAGETKERGVAVLHTVGGQHRREYIPIVFTAGNDLPRGRQQIAYPIKVGGQTVNIMLDVIIK